MSYNIDAMKVKTCILTINQTDLESVIQEYHEPREYNKPDSNGGPWLLVVGEGAIEGTAKNGVMTITSIECFGEGSGGDWLDVVVPILSKTTGTFEAILIWERGDTIERVKVTNGKMTKKEVK